MSDKMILIAEDSDSHFYLMEAHIQKYYPDCVIHRAKTVAEAVELFSGYGAALHAIIVDACLNCMREVDTDVFIETVKRSGFAGPIVTASSHEPFNERLLAAGATHRSLKWDAAQLAVKLLNL